MIKKNKLEKTNKRKLFTMLGLAFAAALLLHSLAPSEYLRPKTTEEFARTSVRITNMAKNSGGSGVILSSGYNESVILTNRHVCKLAENGGYVLREDKEYMIAAIKPATSHDMCEVKVNANLEVNTKVASNPPRKYSDATISGHPLLYPHVLTKGSFSGHIEIQIMVDVRECTDKELQKIRKNKDFGKFMMCMMFGMPVIETYDSQLVSATILPGSSGSAVFDENGEIAGLAFASSSRELSYALIVPQQYVYKFVNEEAPKLEWQKVSYKRDLF
jgi:S1-C subfamily serine protease